MAYVGHSPQTVSELDSKIKRNAGVFRMFKLCSGRFMKQTFRVCMLQHARGTGRPERTSRNHCSELFLGKRGGRVADQQFRNMRNDPGFPPPK